VGLLRFFLWARWIVPVYSTCINRAPNVFFFNKIFLLIKKKKKKVNRKDSLKKIKNKIRKDKLYTLQSFPYNS